MEFRAAYRTADGAGLLHERSRFERRAGRWVYVDGDIRLIARPVLARVPAAVTYADCGPCRSTGSGTTATTPPACSRTAKATDP